MGQMKTPGVYVVEKSAFPSSVVEVATAVPAFIGHTEIASNKGKSLRNVPWRINSLSEFHSYFGAGPTPVFNIADKTDDAAEDPAFSSKGKDYWLQQAPDSKYLLYFCMRLFFQNAGGPCYVVSTGGYKDEIDPDQLKKGIQLLLKEQEPTMVVIPETVLLEEDKAIGVQQAALAHCGGKMKNRIAILDIWNGFRDRQDPAGDPIDSFRGKLGINYLDYSAAYYPWVETTIVNKDKDLSFENVGNRVDLQTLIKTELDLPDQPPDVSKDDPPSEKTRKAKIAAQVEAVEAIATVKGASEEGEVAPETEPAGEGETTAGGGQNKSIWDKDTLDKTLRAISSSYGDVLTEMERKLNLLPPGAAMAGVYTMVDNARGVWKAPANVSLASVIRPSVSVSHDEQEDLNVTTQGKSINAIRSFIGEGVLVWGARTLDGNSLDWRYINVRRTMIMLEESIKLATKAYVFDPNVSTTWVTIRSMITNFLTGIWKRGGLAGATPADAFSVHVGLGETMTPEDILEGILRVTVLVAVSRPAEFIEITFQQQMQKS